MSEPDSKNLRKKGISMIGTKRAISLLISAATAITMISAAAIPASAKNMLMGDVNGDGKVSLRDATVTQKLELGLMTELEDHKRVGDLNGDGKLTIADAYLIQRLATHDPALMDGSASEGIPSFCPNWSKRVAFYDALNTERAARGLPTLAYTDNMLAAGQELCDAWYAERIDTSNPDRDSYSGYRTVLNSYGQPMRFNTVFADYGIQGYSTGALIDAAYGKTPSGKSYFALIKNDVTKKGEDSAYYEIYNDLLMKTNLTCVCIGEVVVSSSSACWVITGF